MAQPPHNRALDSSADMAADPLSSKSQNHPAPAGSLAASRSPQRAWISGFTRGAPIVFGYLPIGFAFGTLAQKAGLSTLNTLLMSLLVYAGSAQLIAVGLFATGTPALSIIATTFVVNLRHLLMSAALAPYLERWRKHELAAFAYELTDESFAVLSLRFGAGIVSKVEAFVVNATAQVAWVTGSWLGTIAGQSIADVRPLALDYALPAMFVALLVLQLRDGLQVGVALFAGLLAVVLSSSGMAQWSIIVATLAGASIGVAVERWTKHRSP